MFPQENEYTTFTKKMHTAAQISTKRPALVNVLIEMNVNISNELNFSDVYRSVNYIGSLAKFTWTPSGLIHFAHDLV